MPSGRHARVIVDAPPAEHRHVAAENLHPAAARAATLAGRAGSSGAAPTGRRRKPAPAGADPAPATGRTVEPAPGGGRHRCAGAPDGGDTHPSTPGSGRRRKSASAEDATGAPTLAIVRDAPAPVVVELGASRLARPVRRAHRRRRTVPAGVPAALVGAAAVATATTGALSSTPANIALGAHSTDLARASALGLKGPSVSQDVTIRPASDPVSQRAERASRERARQALRTRTATAAREKTAADALAKAERLAKDRTARIALLARSFTLPVSGYHLTAGFGDGGSLWRHGHTGQDFACPTGTPIRAIAAGTITFAGWDGSYGYKTVERLDDGTELWYAHQSRQLIRSGRVDPGDIIGKVGSTGNSTGPHVHLEVRVKGVPVDPMTWLRARGLHP